MPGFTTSVILSNVFACKELDLSVLAYRKGIEKQIQSPDILIEQDLPILLLMKKCGLSKHVEFIETGLKSNDESIMILERYTATARIATVALIGSASHILFTPDHKYSPVNLIWMGATTTFAVGANVRSVPVLYKAYKQGASNLELAP